MKKLKPTIHPLLSSQLAAGTSLAEEALEVANYLGELLRDMHGGDWDVSINHEHLFVLIAADIPASA